MLYLASVPEKDNDIHSWEDISFDHPPLLKGVIHNEFIASAVEDNVDLSPLFRMGKGVVTSPGEIVGPYNWQKRKMKKKTSSSICFHSDSHFESHGFHHVSQIVGNIFKDFSTFSWLDWTVAEPISSVVFPVRRQSDPNFKYKYHYDKKLWGIKVLLRDPFSRSCLKAFWKVGQRIKLSGLSTSLVDITWTSDVMGRLRYFCRQTHAW